jgi:hypothetical protein
MRLQRATCTRSDSADVSVVSTAFVLIATIITLEWIGEARSCVPGAEVEPASMV